MWDPGPVCKIVEKENFVRPSEFEPRTFRRVASRYTDYAVTEPCKWWKKKNKSDQLPTVRLMKRLPGAKPTGAQANIEQERAGLGLHLCPVPRSNTRYRYYRDSRWRPSR